MKFEWNIRKQFGLLYVLVCMLADIDKILICQFVFKIDCLQYYFVVYLFRLKPLLQSVIAMTFIIDSFLALYRVSWVYWV